MSEVRITDAPSSRYATVDENCCLIIQDLQWLKSLCLYVGASESGWGSYLKIIDSETKEVFEVKYIERGDE